MQASVHGTRLARRPVVKECRMCTTSYLALSRQVTLERHMATIANNLANAATSGYRAERTVFEKTLQRAGRHERVAFVQDTALARDLAPGPIEQTGNPFDIALNGAGYLAFGTPAGTRYGRAGRLEIDNGGRLVNAGGAPVLDDGGNPVTLPEGERAITIAADGTVSGRTGQLGRIGVVGFAREQALQSAGDGLLTTAESPVPASGTGIVQGALEGSNVKPVLEMTTMLETARAFEGAQRLLDTEHELERQAIERSVRTAG
jgi:flagellar basal-body rod protein FlgF